MDLQSHYPYWLMKNGIVHVYPSLQTNIDTDVAIIGGGISGAMAAYYLYRDDIKVVVLDRKHAGMGSTAASTALLQYELDVPLHTLAEYVGKKNAVHAYKYCRKAIYDLQQICKKMGDQTGFQLKPSLQYASEPKHKHTLYREYGFRLKSGFRVNWLEEQEIEQLFGFKAPGGILSEDAAEVDPYLLTHALLKYVQQKQYGIYDNTGVTGIQHEQNRVILHTDTGHTVRAKKVVVASGYEAINYLPKHVADLYATYAMVSEPLGRDQFWYQNSLVWETAMPYLYFRVTPDQRILIGGKDDPFTDTALRDSRVKSKTAKLLQAFKQKLPDIPVQPDFAWSSTFAATRDGLPYIGQIPEIPNTFFSLGYGGNGMVFSVIAGQIIRDMIKGKTTPDAEIFSFNR